MLDTSDDFLPALSVFIHSELWDQLSCIMPSFIGTLKFSDLAEIASYSVSSNRFAAEASSSMNGALPIGCVVPRGLISGNAVMPVPACLVEGAQYIFDGNNDELMKWISRRTSVLFQKLASCFSESHLALAAARKKIHDYEATLALVEDGLNEMSYRADKIAFRTESARVFARSQAEGCYRLGQHVGMPLSTVTSLALLFSRDGAGLDGRLHIKISGAYSSKLLCDHNISFSRVQRGWNKFLCERGGSREKEPLIISIEFNGPDQAKLSLGLAERSPVPEECAYFSDGISLGRPLAMQISTGIPGLSLYGEGPAFNTATLNEVEPRYLPSEYLENASLVEAKDPSPSFKVVNYEPSSRSLLIHPLGETPTIAKISGVKIPGLKSLKGVVEHRKFEGVTVEFVIYVMPTSSKILRAKDFLEGTDKIASKLNWSSFDGGEWGDVSADLSDIDASEIDIYLLSRTKTEDSHLAQFYLRSIMFTSDEGYE